MTPADQLHRTLGQRLRTALDRKPSTLTGATVNTTPTPRDLHDAHTCDPAPETPDTPPAAVLTPHGEPIDIGWINGTLDARLHLTVHPDMDPAEADQLLADLRDTIGHLVPVRPARAGRP